MEYAEPDITDGIESNELREACDELADNIEQALLEMPLNTVDYIDVVFHYSQTGSKPKVAIRRVTEDSQVKSWDLHPDTQRVIRYQKEDLQKLRAEQ